MCHRARALHRHCLWRSRAIRAAKGLRTPGRLSAHSIHGRRVLQPTSRAPRTNHRVAATDLRVAETLAKDRIGAADRAQLDADGAGPRWHVARLVGGVLSEAKV